MFQWGGGALKCFVPWVYLVFCFNIPGADTRAVHALPVAELLRLHVRVVLVPDAVRHGAAPACGLSYLRCATL